MSITRTLLFAALAIILPDAAYAQYDYNSHANRSAREVMKRDQEREKMTEMKEQRKEMRAEWEKEQKSKDTYIGAEKFGYRMYRPKDSKKWGVIDKYNKTVIPAIYDDPISFEQFSNGTGIAKMNINGKYGFINTKNEVLVPAIYSYADNALTDYTLVLTRENLYGYIDSKSNTVIKAKYKKLSRFNTSGYAVANETSDPGKFGAIDNKGATVIPFIYEEIIWEDNIAVVKKNGKWGALDNSGNTLIPLLYTNQISWNSQGIAYVLNGANFGAVDRTGKTIISFKYCDLRQVNEDIIMCLDGKYGTMDMKENIIVKPVYEDFFYFKNGQACVKQNGNYGLINRSGSSIFYPISNKPISFENGKATIIWNGKYGVINDKGAIVAKAVYDRPIAFDNKNKVAEIVADGKYGLINDYGEIIAKPVYDNSITFDPKTGVGEIVVDGKYGCIHKSGFVIIKPIYEKPETGYFAINSSYAVVKLDNKYGYYNIEGKAITEVKFDHAYNFSNSNVGLVRLKKKQGLVDASGNVMLLEKRLDLNEKYINFWNGNYCPVKGQNGKHGVIDKKGKVIIDFDYQEEVFFGDGLAAVSNRKKNTFEKGLWGFINENGDLVIDYQFEEVYGHFKQGACQVSMGKELFKIDKTGKRLK